MNIENIRIDLLDNIVERLRLHGHDVSVNVKTRELENFGIIGAEQK